MKNRRVGLWLIGAFGGVGTTATLGLAALARGVTEDTSLVTALPLFGGVDLDQPQQFVVGGHDIRMGGFRQTVRELQQRSNIFERGITDPCQSDLEKWEANVRPGTVLNSGPTIARFADLPEVQVVETPRAAVDRIQADLRHFREVQRLDQVVVINVSSTEPPFPLCEVHDSLERLGAALAPRAPTLPPN